MTLRGLIDAVGKIWRWVAQDERSWEARTEAQKAAILRALEGEP